ILGVSFEAAKQAYLPPEGSPISLSTFRLHKQLDEFCREFDAFKQIKRSDPSFTAAGWLHTFIQDAGATRFRLLMDGQANDVLKQLRTEQALQHGRILVDPTVVYVG